MYCTLRHPEEAGLVWLARPPASMLPVSLTPLRLYTGSDTSNVEVGGLASQTKAGHA